MIRILTIEVEDPPSEVDDWDSKSLAYIRLHELAQNAQDPWGAGASSATSNGSL